MTLEENRAEAERLVAALKSDERRVLKWIVEGYSLSNIAGELGVLLEEASQLKASLMKQLGANVTADLVRIGIYAQVDEDH